MAVIPSLKQWTTFGVGLCESESETKSHRGNAGFSCMRECECERVSDSE